MIQQTITIYGYAIIILKNEMKYFIRKNKQKQLK